MGKGLLWSRMMAVAGAVSTTVFLVSMLVYVESQLLQKWGNFRQNFVQVAGFSASPQLERSEERVERDEQCLARSEQHQYRDKEQRLPASKALMESWERYVSLHRFCSGKISNWTDAFMSGNGDAEQLSCRYLIFMEGSAGLGNKILALVSAFGYAMATDRVLLLETGGSRKLGRLLCEPFLGSSWLLPQEFPYETVRQAPPLGAAMEADLKSLPVVNLHLEHIQSSGDQQFFCDSTHHALQDVKWLAWSSTQYYISRILMLPSFWHRLIPLFPDRRNVTRSVQSGWQQGRVQFSVFTQISRLIVVPKNHIWMQLLRVYRAYLSSSALKVGVQIRLHGRWDLAAFDEAVHARVLECLQSHGLLPRLADPNTTNWKALQSDDSSSSSVAVLVASLQQRYYEEMKREYSEGATDDGRVVSVHSCGEGGEQDDTLRQARMALLEMWLLSLSQAIATSAYSTFGYVAHGLAGLRPLVMNVRGEPIQPGEACIWGSSSEPCTHFPMLHAGCPNFTAQESGNPVTLQHQQWMDGHFQPCHDQEGGLQLVWN